MGFQAQPIGCCTESCSQLPASLQGTQCHQRESESEEKTGSQCSVTCTRVNASQVDIQALPAAPELWTITN